MSETQTLLKVTQKKLPASQLGLDIEIPGTRSQKAYEKTVAKLMRTAQIPGFRRGKIPRQVVLQRFGSSHLKAATLEELIQNSLKEALEQEEINILGNLELQSSFEDLVETFKPGDDLSFSASADISPEVTLKKYSDFEVTVEKSVYDAKRIDETLLAQQSAHATLVPVEDRGAQENDSVIVDFVSTFEDDESDDGEDSSGSEMTDFQVELSNDKFLPGFVQGVIGMTLDETKEFEVDFPDDYFEQSLAGRKAQFKVTLKDIKAKELPELTDEFAQEISEFETLEELQNFLEEQYQKEAQDETNDRTNESIVDELVAELEVDLPKTMIDQEVNALLNEMAARFQSQGLDINKLFTKESIPGFQERLRPDAETRVKRTLALAEVAKSEGLEVESEALEVKFKDTLKQLDESKIDRDRLREVLAEELLEEKVLTWVKEHSKITLVDEKDEGDNEEASVGDAAKGSAEDHSTGEKTVTKKKKAAKAKPKAEDDESVKDETKATAKKAAKKTKSTTKEQS